MHKEARMAAIADGSQPADGWIIAIVQFGIIMEQQHRLLLLLGPLPRLLPMRLTEGLMRHVRLMQKPIGCFQLPPPASQLARQAGSRVSGHLGGDVHQPLATSLVSQLRRSKCLLRPARGVDELHQPTAALLLCQLRCPTRLLRPSEGVDDRCHPCHDLLLA